MNRSIAIKQPSMSFAMSMSWGARPGEKHCSVSSSEASVNTISGQRYNVDKKVSL